MKLSTAGKYAIRAMFELVMRQGTGPVSVRDVAERQMIPFDYLEQLFSKLRKAGLVQSIRGVKGGYTLSRASRRVKIGDILRAVEGPLDLGSCATSSLDEVRCSRAEDCVSRIIMVKLGGEISRVLDEITLEDLSKEVGGVKKRQRRDQIASCSL